MSNARFSIIQSRAVSDDRISNAQFRTLSALGIYGDKNGWCFPKLKTLGDMLGKSKQAVSMDIKALVELGYIEIKKQYREDGSQQNNLYRILFDSDDGGSGQLNGGLSPGVNGGLSPELNGGLSPGVDALTPHDNAPSNAPLKSSSDFAQLYKMFESEIGVASSTIVTLLEEDLQQYGLTNCLDAIKIAVGQNKRKWSYVRGILKNQWADGKNKPPQESKKYEGSILLPDGTITEVK